MSFKEAWAELRADAKGEKWSDTPWYNALWTAISMLGTGLVFVMATEAFFNGRILGGWLLVALGLISTATCSFIAIMTWHINYLAGSIATLDRAPVNVTITGLSDEEWQATVDRLEKSLGKSR